MPVRIPSPEELGLASPPVSGSQAKDWTGAHQRLQALGASSVDLEPMPGGGWRAGFGMPTGQANQTQRIQAQADTPEAAVTAALSKADALVAEARRR
jgi:hypothetical protein